TTVAGGHAPAGAAVTVASRGAGKLDLFVVAADGRVMTSAWGPGHAGWSAWSPVGTRLFPPGAPIHVVSRSADKLDIFGVDATGAVVSAAWEPGFGTSWHGWWVLNDGTARPGAPVTAVCRNTDKLDLFLTGDDGTVRTASWQASAPGWHGWSALPPGRRFVAGAPVHVVSRRADKLDVFATDIDGNVMTAAWE